MSQCFQFERELNFPFDWPASVSNILTVRKSAEPKIVGRNFTSRIRPMTIARQNEQVKTQMREQLQHTAHISEARAGGRYVKDRCRAEPQKSQTAQKCERCGYAQHARDRKCPAAGQKCKNCNRRGHFASVCRSSKHTYGPTHATASEVQADGPAGPFLGVVDGTTNNDAWFVTLTVRRNRIRFKVDTGADVTVISEETWLAMRNKPELQPTTVNLNSVGGQVNACGKFNATTRYKQTVYRFDVIVISGNTTNLLARDVAVNMGLVKRLDQIGSSKPASIGLMKTEPVTIKLKTGVEPSCLTTARRIPFPLMDDVRAELDRMVTSEVIRVVTEPTDWCSAMVPVVKKNGTVRICVDLKKLNIAVRREHLMLPSLDDIAPKLAHSKLFSTLDAASGFWQIPLDENGMAERAVQTAKQLLDLENPEMGLLNYRASSHSAIGVPPSVALMGRLLATRLPVVDEQLKPHDHQDAGIRKSNREAKSTYKRYYDKRHGVRELSPLQTGDPVLLKLNNEKQWSQPSTVVRRDPINRSYIVQTGAGVNYRRNRRHLQGVPAFAPYVVDVEPDDGLGETADIPAEPGV